jgi:hypothetical protein
MHGIDKRHMLRRNTRRGFSSPHSSVLRSYSVDFNHSKTLKEYGTEFCIALLFVSVYGHHPSLLAGVCSVVKRFYVGHTDQQKRHSHP